MKHVYKDSMKQVVRQEMIKTIEELNLTKEQTAEILGIDARSFAYLKAGKTMCSSTTLLIYLTRICKNPIKFLAEVNDAIKELEEK